MDDSMAQRAGEAFQSALARHHELLRAEFIKHGGYEFKEAGNAFQVAFARPSDALLCAIAAQKALATEAWPSEVGAIQVRMALHVGEAAMEDGVYSGPVAHRASRMLTAAHGGQILCSQEIEELLHRDLPQNFTDLGFYRLRGAPTPERLFQVTHPDLPHEFPALRAEPGPQSNLPTQLTRFFGRETEMARLREALLDESTRLVTLTGLGGAGKSRLSLEVARSLLETFAGAVWFVALADLSDASLIAGAILDAMRVSRSPITPPLDQAAAALNRQPSILVLDNFEQLVDAGAGIVKTLLERVPTLNCLVTSRQVLGLCGEYEIPLDPLPTPQGAQTTPETLTLYESVRLFVDRARATKPDFQVNNRNAPAVAQLCNRLDGIPLAIELAAARVQTLTPAQMLAELEDDHIEFLNSRKRDVSERHRTLQNTMDWSYHLLPANIRGLFARLSVFRGGWTQEAAQTVCEEPNTPDCLDHLRECSLIRVDEPGDQANAPIRFRMLETIRQHAQKKLTPEEQEALRGCHADCFLRFAEEAKQGLLGTQQGYWLERLEQEHDNFRAALEWSKKSDPDCGLRLAAWLPLFWELRGHLREGYTWLTTFLQRDPGAEPTLRAKALLAAGNLAKAQGGYNAARDALNESYRLLEALSDKPNVAKVLNSLAATALDIGDYAEARRLDQKSYEIKRELDDRPGMATSLLNLGYGAYQQGDLPVAHEHLEAGLAILREGSEPEPRVLANALNNLGGVLRSAGDYAEACLKLEESLNLRRSIGDKRHLAYSLEEFARLAAAQQDLTEAARLLGATEALRENTNCPRPPAEYIRHKHFVTALRKSMDAPAFDTAWAQGQAETLDNIIAGLSGPNDDSGTA